MPISFIIIYNTCWKYLIKLKVRGQLLFLSQIRYTLMWINFEKFQNCHFQSKDKGIEFKANENESGNKMIN